MAVFSFELVSPERILFSGDVESVVLPGAQGEMTVLPNHAPTMTALTTGFLTINGPKGAERMLVQGGFADLGPTTATVLAERAVPASELTGEMLGREIARAEEVLQAASDPDRREAAEETLTRLRDARIQLGL